MMDAASEESWSGCAHLALRGEAWLRTSKLAATALATMPAEPSETEEAQIADIYDSIRGGPAHSKYTGPRRLRGLDAALGTHLAGRQTGTRLRVHDMAASNAITSLEMYDCLRARLPVSVRATDYFDRLLIVEALPGWRAVFDVDLKPIQYVGRRMMLCARRPDPRSAPSERILKPLLQRRLLPPALRALSAGPQRISLFHPRCLARAVEDSGFTLDRDDIFQPLPDLYDAVRVANALSTDFMPEPKVMEGVKKVAAAVTDGGLLVLGRNAQSGDGPVSGTIFTRKGRRLFAVEDILDGYRQRAAVLQLAIE
jgi:hypothetical protein